MIENDSTTQVLEKDCIYLKMTSRKNLILHEVLHVPNIRRNLIDGSLLVARDYKIVLESNKLVITHNNEFIEEGFIFEDS